jgi:hypothetical protein
MVHENFSATSLAFGVTTVTKTVTNAVLTYHLDATDEYLYWAFEVEDNWDGTTIEVDAYVAVGAGDSVLAGDAINASLRLDATLEEGGLLSGATTETRSVGHALNYQTDVALTTHELHFQLTPGNYRAGDVVGARFWLDDVGAGAISSIEVIQFSVKYRTRYVWPSARGGFGSEG